MSVDDVARCGFGWSGETGLWTLRIVSPELELSPLELVWDQAGPPSLLDRYDALATLGFAVARGGPEAWEWVEKTDDEGRTFLLSVTELRLLEAHEVSQRT